MPEGIVSPAPLDKRQIGLALQFLAKKYQPPKYDQLYRSVKKQDLPNLTEQFPALLQSMRGVIQVHDDIGEIATTSAGPQCSHLELANTLTRDRSHLLTLFLGDFNHCEHKPPSDIRPYFANVKGQAAQFCVRAVTVQYVVEKNGVEMAVMLIGEHPDLLTDLANIANTAIPDRHLDERTIAQSFSQLTIHPNGELTTHYYKPMGIALPCETFFRELQGAPLLPPRGSRSKLYSPGVTREKLNPSMFLNPRVQVPREPMEAKDLAGLIKLLCEFFNEVAICKGAHQ